MVVPHVLLVKIEVLVLVKLDLSLFQVKIPIVWNVKMNTSKID